MHKLDYETVVNYWKERALKAESILEKIEAGPDIRPLSILINLGTFF